MSRGARSVRVSGQVQGVFFRQSAVDRAERLAIAGWIRNCPDGSVEALVEGEADALDAIIEWLGRGPAHARVDRIEVGEAEPSGATGFAIRR